MMGINKMCGIMLVVNNRALCHHADPSVPTRRLVWCKRRQVCRRLRITIQDGHLDLRRWSGRTANARVRVRHAHRIPQHNGRRLAWSHAGRCGHIWIRPRPRSIHAWATIQLFRLPRCGRRKRSWRHPWLPWPVWPGHPSHLRGHAHLGVCKAARVGPLHARRHERGVDRPGLRRVWEPLRQILQQRVGAAIFGICGVLVHFFKVWPPVAIFGCAALCLALFMLDISGAYGNWCHVAKYGDFTGRIGASVACRR